MAKIINLSSLETEGALNYGDYVEFTIGSNNSDKVSLLYVVSRESSTDGIYKYYLSNAVRRDNAAIFNVLGIDKNSMTSDLFGRPLTNGGFPFCDIRQLYLLTHALYEVIENGRYKTILNISANFSKILNDNSKNDVICGLLHNNPNLLSSDKINYIDITEDGLLEFLPDGKSLHLNQDGTWANKNRQSGKPASVVRKLISEKTEKDWNLTDKDFENFTNYIKASSKKLGQFIIVSGEEIKKWYDYRNYSPNQGTLDASCMRHDNCQEFFDIYVENPDVISMLILIDYNEKLIGRALIWKLPEFIFMDRVYGSDATVAKFHRYAKENGMVRKYQNTYKDPTTFVRPDDEIFELRFKVILKNVNLKRLPYLDTFHFLGLNEISFCNYKPGRYSFNLQSTNGIPKSDLSDAILKTTLYDDQWVIDSRDYSFIKKKDASYMEGSWSDASLMRKCSHDNSTIFENRGSVCALTKKFYSYNVMLPLIEGGWVYMYANGYTVAADTKQATLEPEQYLHQCYYDKLYYQRDMSAYRLKNRTTVKVYAYNEILLSQQENSK